MKREKTIRLVTGGLLAAALVVSGVTAAQITRQQSAETEENAQTETALADEQNTAYTEEEEYIPESAYAGDIMNNEAEEGNESEDVQTEKASDEETVSTDSENVEAVTDTAEEKEENASQETAASVSGTQFTENGLLEWPVEGTVAIDYSMDTTTYFSTLNVYKCNPAMIISATEGDPVQAAADGTILSVSANEETGTTVTVDMGGGYEAVYGQLKDVSLEQGDSVLQGDILGYIAETTRYYSKEGDNLYFSVTKDGSPVDPTQFMETEND